MSNADQSDVRAVYSPSELLPEALPADPMPIVEAWLREAEARRDQPNPNAMTLATVDADGTPSARVVLCKGFAADPGYVVFYTNYQGRKGRALTGDPRAAVVFHWDHQDRQVRIEGPVVRSPASESDAYFATRPVESRIGAWASAQSEPIGSRAELLARVDETMARFGVTPESLRRGEGAEIPRPPNWGGWRVWARRVELWVGGPGRVHDRAGWTRELRPGGDDGFTAGAWSATRLCP